MPDLSQFRKSRHFAFFQACIIGLVAGIAAVIVRQGVEMLGSWRVRLSTEGFGIPGMDTPFNELIHAQSIIVLPIFGLVGGLAAGWLVERFAPQATGSGIPQVKAVIAGAPIALDLKLAVVKVVSGILALGSGFPLGREGPTVQVGGALAAELSRTTPSTATRRRQLIAAGAGTGLAAAFHAPIAGILFVVEELLKDASASTLGVAIFASFVGSMVSQMLGGHALGLDFSQRGLSLPITLPEIPAYIILGVLAGVFGAIFNKGIITSLKFNNSLPFGLTWRVGAAGLIIGLTVALLPLAFHDNAELRHLVVTGQASLELALLSFLVQFALTIIAYGSGAPGGLFAPALMLGASLGYSVGTVMHSWTGLGAPTTYALVGMGALFSAVARVPVTAIVIVFEMTTDFSIVLPLMITSIVAYLVAEELYRGSVYDRILELSGIKLDRPEEMREKARHLTAADIMQIEPSLLPGEATIQEALDAFTQTHHHSFPVVKDGTLLGVLTESDLLSASRRGVPTEDPVVSLMTPQPITVGPSEPIVNIRRLLSGNDIGALPVIAEGRLVGLITRSDILRTQLEDKE